jgi:hypothetical protein
MEWEKSRLHEKANAKAAKDGTVEVQAIHYCANPAGAPWRRHGWRNYLSSYGHSGLAFRSRVIPHAIPMHRIADGVAVDESISTS